MTDSSPHTKHSHGQEGAIIRLQKRLAYILRYGALKEGLDVDENGYVDLDQLLGISLFKDYSRDTVLNSIKTSIGCRLLHRYSWLERGSKVYVRASYQRNLEKNPFHLGSKVPTLFETSMTYILTHLEDYDLQEFPDEYIIRAMIHRLKRQKKHNLRTLKSLLVSTLTQLDLEGIFLTNNTMRAVWTQCPHLEVLSLKNCGYILTDTMLQQLTKNLPKLKSLNLSHCHHLTPSCLKIIVKNLPHLQVLNVDGVRSLRYQAVHEFLVTCKELKSMDVFSLRTDPQENASLMEVASKKNIKLIIKDTAGMTTKKAEMVKTDTTDKADDDNSDEDSLTIFQKTYDLTSDDIADIWCESFDSVYVSS